MKNIILVLPLLIFSIFVGCSDDHFTTNPNDRLTFSADTVRFDTVFSTVSSSTKRLMLYNKNSKAINIDLIQLKNGDDSGFRINVDGMRGTSFQNVEIYKKDSMFVFIEVTPSETNNNEPTRQLGKIELQYNGIQQEIVLESYAQDAIWLRGKVISRDTTLTGEKPFLIYDSLYVMPDVTLTLEKNVRFFIHDKTDILIDGTLICNGERNTPVVFRGERTDRLFSNLPYDEMASQWGGMRITENSYDNRMSFTEFRGASKGLVLDSADVNRMKLTIESSKFKLAGSDLLNAECVKMEVSNSLFTNSAGALISLNGGDYRFTHCTLANLFNQGSINNMALHLNNYKLDNNAVPQPLDLTRAEFNNCIIWGKRDLEVNLDSAFLNKPVDALYNFRFDHCLIKARGENDDKFISTVWNENPEFIDTGEEYFFDYHIGESSGARGKGNIIYSYEVQEDLDGESRNTGIVDIGAYQFK